MNENVSQDSLCRCTHCGETGGRHLRQCPRHSLEQWTLGSASAAPASANDIQVAGDHYKSQQIQPWDFIAANKIGYFEGNVIKYVARWQVKGGVTDLKKAQHYLTKLIELTEQAEKAPK